MPGPARISLLVSSAAFLVLVLFVARQAEPMFPVADEAVTELATLNALHGRQLLGPYSRYPWHHPGPSIFYLLAPMYEASGKRAASRPQRRLQASASETREVLRRVGSRGSR